MQNANQTSPTPAQKPAAKSRLAAIRYRLYEIVEVGRGVDRASQLFDAFIISLIIINVACFMLDTVPSIEAEWGRTLYAIEVFSVAIFTIEYIARLWTAVEVPFLKRLPPWKARINFAVRPFLIIDLLAILPFYLGGLFGLDLRVLRILRLLRLMKLSRYSPAMHTLIRVIYNERKSLSGAGLLLCASVILTASGMYFLEHQVQPNNFGSVPQATYWAITTLTTVGYGDVVPHTPLGKLFAMFTMVAGLCILALPVAIVSTGFAQEVGRRDFVVTWSLMSRIPVFADLNAVEVAKIMPLLHAQNYPPNVEIALDASGATAMFFIASGEIDARHSERRRRYSTGDFFGITTLHEHGHATGHYYTRKKCRLLKLYHHDFAQLEHAHPSIAEHIRKMAELRYQADVAAEAAAPNDPKSQT